MGPCVFIIFSFLLLFLETTTTNQSEAPGGGGGGKVVIRKCYNKERQALLHFKSHLQDSYDSDHLTTWRADEHDCCKWRGVTCNNQTGRVINLEIRNYNLEGEIISRSLPNLCFLNHLDLSVNFLYGNIPTFIGSMTRLRYLDLSLNVFNGTVPRSIGLLTELRYLDLSINSLYGTIPPEFGNLTNLQIVENLEWLSRLSQLEALALDGISLAKQNHWVDVIMSLWKLSLVGLSGCELSQVIYPYSSSFLNSSSSSIVYLYLQNNNLTSSMDHWLFLLTNNNLSTLDLSGNMLDGIPKYIGSLCNLTYLYLNNISAIIEFPVFLNNLSRCTSLPLQWLDASHSQFAGPPSYKIQTLTNLTHLEMSSCNLGPSFPKWIQTLKNLYTIPMEIWDMWPSQLICMNLSSNNISGKAPDLSLNFNNNSVIDLSSNGFYEFLDLSYDFLSGQIPECLWHFKELKVLNLGHNNLSGRLPPSIGSLIQLEVLDLHKNGLFGELPLSIKNCTNLTTLILGANKFSSNVPVWIGEKLSWLYVLILRSNIFFGTIPLQLCQLQKLQILDLSMNHLHGTIPSCLDNLMSMVQKGLLPTQNVHSYSIEWYYSGGGLYDFQDDEYVDHAMIEWQGDEHEFFRNMGLLKSIDLSSNNLTGQIPYEITNLYQLISLNLSNNALLGEIPLTIGQMKQLETLDLSRNNLSGEMPLSMSGMSFLNHLDVSYNNLSGRIPSSTQLQSFPPSTYDGNTRLCGPPLTKKCTGDEESEPTSVNGKSGGDGEDIDEVWGWFYIGGGTGFATGFWIAIGALLLNRRGRHAFFFFTFMIASKIGFM
uniref:Leucine-rich repeat-containing N-terminal plant-type domain-containing protein n=1 Tax=Lactuca sativa TaxID=4236 RepID=A0A9R1V4L6_LACSA|nr:hypothetical protein LSAT_V11C600317300 [Lactuca sativa]